MQSERITEIPPSIAKMKNLEFLDIQGHVKKIEHVSGLQKLEILLLNANDIEKIENLKNLPSLKKLHLGANPISKIEGLEHLGPLDFLTLGYTSVTDLSGIACAKHIKEFSIKGLKLKELKYLPAFKNIEILDASKTNIGHYDYESFYDKGLVIVMLSNNIADDLYYNNEQLFDELRAKQLL